METCRGPAASSIRHRPVRVLRYGTTMPAVNPKILVWARETAGLTRQGAVRKIGIKDAYGMAAVDRLAELERGEKEPTRPILVKMAQYYRRPLLAFYLYDPPPRSDRGADFRMLPTPLLAETEALVDALVRNVQSRQKMVRAVLESEDEAKPLPFVGSLRRPGEPVSSIMARDGLHQVLGYDLTARKYYEQPSQEDAFALLRERAESLGVFVILKGDLGSYHTSIDVDVFRGFAIADDIAPFVVINDKDSKPAWSFTLLHELVHLLLGQTGISASYHRIGIEELCNQAAAEWMLPAQTLNQVEIDQDITEQQHLISEFARRRNLSHTMVAYQLLRAKRIDQQTFARLRAVFKDRWQHERAQQRLVTRKSEGGPNYYVVRRHRVGQPLLQLTSRMVGSDALSITKAAMILDVKPRRVSKLLCPM